MTMWRVITLVVLVSLAAFFWWMFVQDGRIDAYNDACRDAGGVAVKSHYGPRVCIDRDALIDVRP